MGLKTAIRNMALSALMGKYFNAKTSRRNRTLAITFDDGPDPIYTPMVLDVLKANSVSATFFIIGALSERHPEIVRRIIDEGHEIGNHAYRHVKFAALPVRDQLDEIDRTDRLLTQYDGRPWHWFRPPQGRLPLKLLLALRRQRHRIAMWSYDSLDSQAEDVASIQSRFLSKPVSNGDVILFHDDSEASVLALKVLLGQWRAQGYEFSLLGQHVSSNSILGMD